MAKPITGCTRCGCQEFRVVEAIEWRGQVDDAGLLGCTISRSEIEIIHCADCHAPYRTSSFAGIDFN